MTMIGKGLRIAAGAIILAAAITSILSFPGFVSDRDSMVPTHGPAMSQASYGPAHAGRDGGRHAAEGTP